MRAGVWMLGGVGAVNVGNYLFHVVVARNLGPNGYGDLVALLTLSTLATLPLAAVQIVVSSYVAGYTAVARPEEARRLNRRVVFGTTLVSITITLAIVACLPIIRHSLSIKSPSAIVLTALLTLPAALTPVVWGVAQGLQRFALLALAMTVGTSARIAALVVFLAVGMSTSLAVAATLFSMVVSVMLPLVPLRSWFRQAASAVRGARPGRNKSELKLVRTTVPAALALLAFTSLTQADVLAANATFTDTTSGIYGAASLVGRIILYLPAAIVAVLLPKVAARTAANRRADDILGLSLIVTLVFCIAATAGYAALSTTIMRVAFGGRYESGSDLLVPFGIAMTALALTNVLLYYHLGRGKSLFAWLLAGAAVAQVVAFSVAHASPRWIIADTIVVTTLLLGAHEALTGLTMVRSMARSIRLLRGPQS